MTKRKRLTREEQELQDAQITPAVREFDIEFGGIPEYKAPDPVIVYHIEFDIRIGVETSEGMEHDRFVSSGLQTIDKSWLSNAASMFNKLSRSEKLAWLKKSYPKSFKLERSESIIGFDGTFKTTIEEYELRMQ